MGGLAGVHRALGDLLAFAGFPSVAAQAFRDAIAIERDPETYIRLGEAFAAARRWVAAAGAFAAAARLRPGSLEAQGSLVLSLARAGRPRECLAAVAELVRLRPFEAEPHLLRSALLLRLGRRADALQAMRWAARLDGPPAGRRCRLGEELFGAAAWDALLDRHRSARALVESPRGAEQREGKSVLNGVPGPVAAATPRRTPVVCRRRGGSVAWMRSADAPVALLGDWGRAAASRVLIAAAGAFAVRRPDVAIRSLRAGVGLKPPPRSYPVR
jgi:tetratricopeptide (TPR) repeat protein